MARQLSSRSVSLAAALALSVLPSRGAAFGPERGYESWKDPTFGVAQLVGVPHTVITEDGCAAVLASELGIATPTDENARAIRAIALANMMVDQDQTKGQYHVDGETFRAAHNRVDTLRQHAIAAMVREDYETARSKIGEALHTIQDFYSHSNWIELENETAHPRFAAVGATLSELPGELAQPTDRTCLLCDYERYGDDLACKDNLHTEKLTSGYYAGEKGAESDALQNNRETKCNHGGYSDLKAPTKMSSESLGMPSDQRDVLHTDGINKDTNSRTLSPHFWLHKQAVKAAVDATRNYLLTIRAGTTLEQFRALFSTASSFGVALDYSNSMEDVMFSLIDQVKLGTAARRDTQAFPSRLVFVGFSDPDVGPSYAGTNNAAFSSAVDGCTRTKESGDCPERSLDATLQVLWSSDTGGIVFVITDADAQNKELAARVNEVAVKRQVRVHPLLLAPTGNPCGPYNEDSYRQIAANTGGMVHRLSRNEAIKVGALLEELNQPTGHLNMVKGVDPSAAKNVASNKGAPTAKAGPAGYALLLDSTASRVTILVSGVSDADLIRPNGTALPGNDPALTKTVLNGEVILQLRSPEPGTWHLMPAGEPQTVHVTSDASLAVISLDFAELNGRPGHQGLFPISGLPIAGAMHDVVVSLTEPVQDGKLELRTTEGEVLSSGALRPAFNDEGKPVNDGHYSAAVMVPRVPFIPYLLGKRMNGEAFERSHMSTKQAQYVAMTVPPQQTVHPGDQVSYQFVLQNQGQADKFIVHVSDKAGFVAKVADQTLSIDAGGTASVVVAAKAPEHATYGQESIISVDVSSLSDPSLQTYGSVTLEVTENVDTDDDGVLNAQDNCPNTSNADQLDYDGDRVGNACDTTPGMPPPRLGCSPLSDDASSQTAQAALGALALAFLFRRKRARS